jgi:methyl coenzyme M reductase beta subunit
MDKTQIHIQDFSAAYVPQYQEVIKQKPWVSYGEDNMFPNHLLALYQYSALNRACLNAIMYGVKGKTLMVKEGDINAIGMANRNETLYEVFEKCATDRVLFGGFALNIERFIFYWGLIENQGSLSPWKKESEPTS